MKPLIKFNSIYYDPMMGHYCAVRIMGPITLAQSVLLCHWRWLIPLNGTTWWTWAILGPGK